MECKYTFNNESGLTWEQLLEKFSEDEIQTALSILYSRSQDSVYDSLLELKKKHAYAFKAGSYSGMDGEPTVDTKDKEMTIQQFIDSHYFTVDGEAPMFKMVFADYLKYKKEQLINSKRMREEEAEAHINTMKDRWEIIAKDAFDLHKLLVSVGSNADKASYEDFRHAAKDTSFSKIVDKLKTASDSVIRQVFLRNGSDHIGGNTKGRLIKNINLAATLKGFDEELVGHIDYLIVRDNGDIEVFNIKSSTETFSNWDPVKKEKYRYQMAFLKRILEFNGISAKHIRMNIIPVKMTYDSSFEHVLDLDVEPAIAMDFSDQEYILKEQDLVAERFIPSNVTVHDLSGDSVIKLHAQLQKIFPGKDIEAFGVKETAKSWVKRYWKQLHPTPLDEGGWEIVLPGEKESIKVTDARYGENNEEIVNLVNDRLNELSENVSNEKGIYRVISDIKNAYARAGRYEPSGAYGSYLGEQFSKYFEHTVDAEGKYNYTWELLNLKTLHSAGILVFRNKHTYQLDVITLTTHDVALTYPFKGRDNLLGYYLNDLNSHNFTMKSTYGNIEAIRTMTVLNELLPQIDGEFKLGELKVLGISHQMRGKKGVWLDLSRLAPQFDTIVNVVNANANAGIVNNFKEMKIQYVDPSDVLVQQWQEIMGSDFKGNIAEIKALGDFLSKKQLVDGTVIEGLLHLNTVEAKVEKLEMLIEKLKQLAQDRGIRIGDLQHLVNTSKYSRDDLSRAIATLYIAATKALNVYYGDLSLEDEKFGKIAETMLRVGSVPNSNVRQVGFMFQKAVDKIANDMTMRYTPIKEVFMEFYKDAGYTKTQNALIGNQASVYEHLYETDENGQRLMQFKNPYDEFNDLKNYERKFLKRILYEFHKIRCEMLGRTNDITGPDDPKLKSLEKIPRDYFNAPLERASAATRRTHMADGFVQWGKRAVKLFTKPKEFFEENQGLLDPKEILVRHQDIENLQAYNPFLNSEAHQNTRNSYIADKGGSAYFEYNVENLFIDFMEKHIQSTEFNRLLTRAKGIELDLILRGEVEQDEEAMKHTITTIDDFLKTNVFNASIMSEDAQKVDAFLAPLRSAVSKLYVAGNIAGAFRDTFQGLLENITSAVIKFQTSIDVKDVAFGYKEVMSEGVNNLMTMSKLNQFNVKYRLSNLDVARISEGQKTGRGGILNAENWAFSTLRGPDYLNRMVLFVAQMHKDGCYDAYTLNKEQRLEYNWRKDKRFNLYDKGEAGKAINIEEYNKQKSLYYSLIRAFNLEGFRKENGEQLNYTDDLPDAYTAAEIQTFKTLSDNIYGSYNKATKAKYENMAIGRNFAPFSTWMNGIVDVYMKKTQESQGEMKFEQEHDYNGQPLFFNEDGTTTTEDTGVPVMRGVPMMVQGIFATLGQAVKTFYHFGFDENGHWSAANGWKAMNKEVFSNEIARRNLRRLLRDLLIGGIFATLFKMLMKELYKDHKESAKGNDVVSNAVVEVLYKSSTSCFDTFMGPMALLEYVGNQTNPATYAVSAKVVRDLWSFALGEKTTMQLLMNAQALPRSFQDTYKLWLRDNKPSE